MEKEENEEITIPLNKVKILMMFLLSTLFFVLGFWLMFGSFESHTGSYSRYSYVKEPFFRFPAGFFFICFFGTGLFLMFIKLFSSKPGLVINNKGIINQSTGVSGGLILWDDIEKIIITEASHQRFVMIILKNHQKYLKKVESRFKRKVMELNYNSIKISANTLQISTKNLHLLLTEKMKEFKK